jgi:adenylate cyclase
MMTSRSVLWRVLRALLLVVLVLVALGHASGLVPLSFVTQLDLVIADYRLRAFMPGTLDTRIVIVDIDEASLAAEGRWPWSRDRMAALTNELFDNQRAAVVGFDMLFPEPDASSGLPALERLAANSPPVAAALAPLRESLDFDARFARALTRRNVVLGYYFTNERDPGVPSGTDPRNAGVMPAPVFDAAALEGRPIVFTRWYGFAASLAIFAREASAAGFINNAPDPDGMVRSIPLISQFEGSYFEPLSLAMYRVFTGAPAVRPGFATGRWLRRDYNALESVVLVQGAERQPIPVDAVARVRVPFRGAGGPKGGSFKYVSATDLLHGRIPTTQLQDKLVLVGTSAPGNYDQRPTPVADVFPGVEVHANLLSGMLDARLPAQPDWASGFDVLQIVAVAALLVWVLPRQHAVRGAQLAAVMAMALVTFNLWAYRAQNLLLPLAAALLLTALIYVGTTVWGYIVEGRSRRSLARLFGTYVPPELVEEMARDPDRYTMRAENRELTVMFCDLRDFTQLAEQLKEPEKLRVVVNAFFTTMTSAIGAHRGTLDKYIGDSIMAFWGAPKAYSGHAANAIRAALEMKQRLETLNKELSAEGKPALGMGIGLNTGEVFVGEIGSPLRRSYTVMGDPVNVASRIEGLTRHYGVEILLGDATRAAAERPTPPDVVADRNWVEILLGFTPAAADRPKLPAIADWRWLEIDRVRGKGMKRPVTLFTPVRSGTGPGSVSEEEMRLWPLALEAYRHHHWSEAKARLEGLQTTFAGSPLETLYTLITERCDRYGAKPPSADWDGVHTFDSK